MNLIPYICLYLLVGVFFGILFMRSYDIRNFIKYLLMWMTLWLPLLVLFAILIYAMKNGMQGDNDVSAN